MGPDEVSRSLEVKGVRFTLNKEKGRIIAETVQPW
jgi:hypothetical protein